MKHTILVSVENKFGVLARISGLFSARGYNISSLAVGETQDPSISSMTIVVDAPDERILDQIKKQLNRLIDVISVVDMTKRDCLERELVLVKVNIGPKTKDKVRALAKKYKAAVIEINPAYVILEATLEQSKINEFLEVLKTFGISELVRTGRIAMVK